MTGEAIVDAALGAPPATKTGVRLAAVITNEPIVVVAPGILRDLHDVAILRAPRVQILCRGAAPCTECAAVALIALTPVAEPAPAIACAGIEVAVALPAAIPVIVGHDLSAIPAPLFALKLAWLQEAWPSGATGGAIAALVPITFPAAEHLCALGERFVTHVASVPRLGCEVSRKTVASGTFFVHFLTHSVQV